MKFILIIACLALYVTHTQAQDSCPGWIIISLTSCSGGRNDGNANNVSCRFAANNNMWWYDPSDRTCKTMTYRGCGGNDNRFCNRAICESRCRR